MLKGDAVFVKIEGSDQGIAPGQFAVFYEKEVCLGCGMISEPPLYLSQYTSSLPEYDYRSLRKVVCPSGLNNKVEVVIFFRSEGRLQCG